MAPGKIRGLIWASVIVQLLGLAVDALWHGLLHPEFEGTARAEMARHLLSVHLLIYLGVLALLVSTLMALVARARAGSVGIAVPVMVAGAVAQTIGEAWHAWSHLEMQPSPTPSCWDSSGWPRSWLPCFSRGTEERRRTSAGASGRGRSGASSPSADRARAHR